MPVLSKRIVLDCFYLLIFYFEKFSTAVCRLPCAVNVNLNLSINHTQISYDCNKRHIFEKNCCQYLRYCTMLMYKDTPRLVSTGA